MPKIVCGYDDLQNLMGKFLDLDELEKRLSLVKGELKGYDEEERELRIELNDTNRPDLWCTEGIARQLRIHDGGALPDYSFFDKEPEADNKIIVDPEMEKIRPYVAAFKAGGIEIDEPLLVQLIQTQEKLCENFGAKRELTAIGIYSADMLTLPVNYQAADPHSASYIPLGYSRSMTLSEILQEHPKGIEYAHLLNAFSKKPFLTDSKGAVLSMPPIINSRTTGELKVGDSNLFVEGTGTDFRVLMLSLNILAANLADRGAIIEPIMTEYPYDTPEGHRVKAPFPLQNKVELDISQAAELLGEKPDKNEMIQTLEKYGCNVSESDGKNALLVETAPYRQDYLHPVDVIEDYAMSRGFNSFEVLMPPQFTIGAFKAVTHTSNKVRDLLIGFGFEEIISNILGNPDEYRNKMRREDITLAEVENVMTETYSALRDSILPSLLSVESASSTAAYPHKIFEVGEVVLPAPHNKKHGTKTEFHCAALIAHPEAGFSEIQTYLDTLFYYLNIQYELENHENSTFLPGRAGKIVFNAESAGVIGEIHPQVLENWNITMPCSVFEISLGAPHEPEIG